MKIAIHLAHPAQFHLFKNLIHSLRSKTHTILVTYTQKDVLEELILDSPIADISQKLSTTHEIDSPSKKKRQFVQHNIRLFYKLKGFKPDIIIGTSIIVSIVGKFLKIPSLIFNEDDFDIIGKTSKIGYPLATTILCPQSVRTGKFQDKVIRYSGYHELAYLHPKYFKPSQDVVAKYFPPKEKYFVLRLVDLRAHHDKGINGITNELATAIIARLEEQGNVYISSERRLEKEFERYRVNIDPSDIHHVLAHASLFIGDSQSMSMESGVLGTPFIRVNDFVGRISVLEELENKYELGFGVKPARQKRLFELINYIVTLNNAEEIFKRRRDKLLGETIDVTAFFVWFIDRYPERRIQLVSATLASGLRG